MAAEAVWALGASRAKVKQSELPPLAGYLPVKESASDMIGHRLKTELDLDDLCVDLDSDFAVSAFQHLSSAVQALTAEHQRRIGVLQKENIELNSKLKVALERQPVSPSAVGKSEEPYEPAQNTCLSSSFASPNANSAWKGGNDVGDGQREEEPRTELDKDPRSALANKDSGRGSSQDSLEQEVAKETLNQRFRRLVASPKFDSLIGGVIIGNTLVMSFQLEYNGRVFKDEILDKCTYCDVRNARVEDFFKVMEHIFTGIFTVELLIRMFTEGCRYWTSASNALDGLIVIVSMADSWVFGPMGSDVLGSVAVLRLIRLLRLAKVLRVVRVMKEFKSLRVLVAAVVNSVGALGWSMTLLFVLELVGAIFMAQVIQPFMEEETTTAEDEVLQMFIWKSFGTWANAMFTIFEITMAPGGFIKYRLLYEEVHPLFGLFFVLYVCVVTFAVVRVITAMFLKATLSASDSEEHDTAEEKSAKWANTIRAMKSVEAHGRHIDEESLTITIEELEDLLLIEDLSKWLTDVGLLPEEVKRMFCSLGQGSNKAVKFSEFTRALRQMSGLPRAANSVLNLYDTRDILDRVTRLESRLATR